MLKEKYIVVHAGSRDFYQVALALREANKLKYLVTDDYILRKEKPLELKGFIKTSYRALLLALAYKVFHNGKINNLKDRALSNFAYKLAKRDESVGVLSYSYYSTFIFKHFKGKKILFQLHPHPLSVRKIFEEEIAANPISKTSLSQEHELLLEPAELKKMAEEPNYADHILSASSFTKSTLINNHILPEKIQVIPYGVSQLHFKQKPIEKRQPGVLKVLFVGSWNQRKGLSYLASAVKKLQTQGLNIQLIIIGRGIMDKELVARYELQNVEYRIDLPLAELINNYHEADVFVFPSLCEGFGHVLLEAMSCGLPVITTNHTAGPDLLTEGVNGFIVPIKDIDALADRLEFLYHNPQQNIQMGSNASLRAREFTWEKFRKGIVQALDGYK